MTNKKFESDFEKLKKKRKVDKLIQSQQTKMLFSIIKML